ncbi:hypothetical protein Taro_002436 [Colocasia esculenta]|uniref:Uncharacterized protein n=1 Tax=Colocasia esculenta TaxID=4460 RepID=A0A843TLL5_COLES|nr:hypothetical protein [Colocasia esculenta]
MWRNSWQLGEQEIPTPSRSSSPSRLLRPAQTVHLKSTEEQPHVKTRNVWSAIQSTVLSLADVGQGPENVTAR